jgi:hypothetical protein
MARVTTLSSQEAASFRELLDDLGFNVFRVRIPERGFWSMRVLPADSVKGKSQSPEGLSHETKLISVRDLGFNKLEYILPIPRGFTKGELNVCDGGVSCKGPYSIAWRKSLAYSAEGDQCVIADIADPSGQPPSLFLVLVRVSERWQI